MLIEIIAVGAKQKIKTYYQIEVTYKDLDKDRVGAKKLMSFSYPEVFNTLGKAEKGEQYGINLKKEGDFWQWTEASKAEEFEQEKKVTKTEAASTRVTGGGNWETKEERAQRQVFIIRQSCLGHAVEFLKYETSDKNEIFTLAANMEQWVIRKDPMKELINLPDDVIE